jgi:acylphosphatase
MKLVLSFEKRYHNIRNQLVRWILMKKLRIQVQGRVQGVGFRYTTKLLADRMGIKGSVKNEADGSVTIEAIGEDAQITKFVEAVKDSPSPAGKVASAKIQEDPSIKERTSFDVEYGY